MKTATIMTRDDRVLCVEMYDSETGICEIFNESDAAEIFDSETVYVWGNGSFFEKCVDLKQIFFDRQNFYISFRAFGPFKSIKPAVQLCSLLDVARSNGRVFWRTKAGAEKAWWDPIFLKL